MNKTKSDGQCVNRVICIIFRQGVKHRSEDEDANAKNDGGKNDMFECTPVRNRVVRRVASTFGRQDHDHKPDHKQDKIQNSHLPHADCSFLTGNVDETEDDDDGELLDDDESIPDHF